MKVPIHFVEYNGKGLFSKFIKFWTKGPSHISYLNVEHNKEFEKEFECWFIPGQAMNEMRIEWGWVSPPFKNHRPGTKITVWELMITDEQRYDIEHIFASEILGRGYDWKGIFGFVFKWRGHKEKGWFCSEGCIYPLTKVFGWNRIQPNHIAPVDFVRIIQAAGGREIYKGPIEGWPAKS